MHATRLLNVLHKTNKMKKTLLTLCIALLAGSLFAQATKTIALNPPDTNGGLPVMKALKLRASATKYDTAMLKLQDISDLLWAANGVNRPASGKRTAPSAINAQDIDVYVVMKSGAYLYDAPKHILTLIAEGNHRASCAGKQELDGTPPLFCVLVSDISKFSRGVDSTRLVWAAEDAGIVSQNISLFCASEGMSTRVRATMDITKLREVLRLKDSQYPVLNHPVSYKKE
jgi:SagB-type dehydrogenase family enzyme